MVADLVIVCLAHLDTARNISAELFLEYIWLTSCLFLIQSDRWLMLKLSDQSLRMVIVDDQIRIVESACDLLLVWTE